MKKLAVPIAAGIAVLGIMATTFAVFSQPAAARYRPNAVMSFPDIKKGDRLTFVVAHPDDETVGLGGLIYRARVMNVPVSVIFLTNGDNNALAEQSAISAPVNQSSMIQLGKYRQDEAIQALGVLGVPQKSIYFLGLPDGGLEAILSSEHWKNVYTNPSTGFQSSAGYDRSYDKNLIYTGKATQNALIRLVNSTRPTRIFTTMREDTHRDHWAAGQLVQTILPKIVSRPHVYSFLVHYPGFAQVGDGQEQWLRPPPSLLNRPWDEIVLSADEQSHQAQAIQKYQSELNSGSADSITNFSRPDELVIE